MDSEQRFSNSKNRFNAGAIETDQNHSFGNRLFGSIFTWTLLFSGKFWQSKLEVDGWDRGRRNLIDCCSEQRFKASDWMPNSSLRQLNFESRPRAHGGSINMSSLLIVFLCTSMYKLFQVSGVTAQRKFEIGKRENRLRGCFPATR
jgi:hypothetical protein